MTTTKDLITILRDSVTHNDEIPAYVKSYIIVMLNKIEDSIIVVSNVREDER